MKSLVILVFCMIAQYSLQSQSQDRVYFATGFKIGEVTDSSVVILSRLNKNQFPKPIYHKQGTTNFGAPLGFEENLAINQMDGYIDGIFGQIRINLINKTDTIKTNWEYVSSYKDFTIKKRISGLTPNTTYAVLLEGRKSADLPITTIKGRFKTPPSPNDIVPVVFTSSTCQYFWSFDDSIRGFKAYDSMKKLNPAFHCQTGDYVYYDKPGPMANNIQLARHKWHAMNSRLSILDFFKDTPLYIQKDDHDLLRDDATPFSPPLGEISYEDGLQVWREQVPILDKPYRTFRWGKDLQIWLVEGREYRNKPNKSNDDKEKTIWGKEQIEWFKQTVTTSDATFKILVSPTPVVGPDRDKGKYDNHTNSSYATEGEWLRNYLLENDMLVINGDRHWQYASVDSETGVYEFSAGPISNNLATGWNEKDKRPQHNFLRVNGGFLVTKVYRKKGKPIIEFIHYDVDGNKVNKEKIYGNKS